MSDEPKECILECESFSNSARNKAKNMSCPELLEAINKATDTEKRGRMGGKGLIQRLRDYLGDDATHHINIEQQSRSLRTYLDEYIRKGYGDPPGSAVKVLEETKEFLKNHPDTTKALAVVGTAGIIAYGAYRVLRFLPSLAPPLWWTIPENLAIP